MRSLKYLIRCKKGKNTGKGREKQQNRETKVDIARNTQLEYLIQFSYFASSFCAFALYINDNQKVREKEKKTQNTL